MKRLLILFSLLFLLSGCGCLLSQIPPQYLQVDNTCGAALPDYLTKISVQGNCNITSVEQTPSAGSWLTVPTTTVLIRAKYNTNDFVDMMFTVTLVDTRKPIFVVTDTALLSNAYHVIDSIYNFADRILARQMWFEESFMPDSLITSDDYCNNVMLTWTDPCKAFTGEGFRVWTFVNPGDTLIIPIASK